MQLRRHAHSGTRQSEWYRSHICAGRFKGGLYLQGCGEYNRHPGGRVVEGDRERACPALGGQVYLDDAHHPEQQEDGDVVQRVAGYYGVHLELVWGSSCFLLCYLLALYSGFVLYFKDTIHSFFPGVIYLFVIAVQCGLLVSC